MISYQFQKAQKKRKETRKGGERREGKEGKEVFFICVVLFSVIVCFGRDDKVG